ncbi:MAG: hypothetical protein WD009_07140 [Phycisphaeraceae bacterium]
MHFEPVGEPETRPRRLSWREPRPFRGQNEVHGFGGCIFGVPLTAGGVLIMLSACGAFGPDAFMAEVPAFGAMLGLLFFFGGVLFTYVSLRGGLHRSEREDRVAATAETHYMRDYPWNRDAAEDDRVSNGIVMVCVAAVIGAMVLMVAAVFNEAIAPLFASPLAWPALLGVGALVAFFGVMGLYLGHTGTRDLLTRFRHGPIRLVYERFPFYLGEAVRGRLEGLPELRAVTLRLRYIKEDEGSEDEGRSPSCEQRWAQAYELREFSPGDLPGSSIAIDLPLPASDSLSTQLATPSPRYWELVVEGRRPFARFRTTLLLPVYAPPSPRGS